MKITIECEQEEDDRWIAEVPQIPGALCYGASAEEAVTKVAVLALRALGERLERGESRLDKGGLVPWGEF